MGKRRSAFRCFAHIPEDKDKGTMTTVNFSLKSEMHSPSVCQPSPPLLTHPASSLKTVRFVQYNGGVGAKQMRWLESQLAQASRAGQRVVMFGHLPVHPGASESKCLLWNFDEVRCCRLSH